MHQLFLADFGLFVGRFHPLLVHLPIGFLLLAALLEWWPGDKARPAIRISWFVGAVSAVAAAGCGWLLAAESGGGDGVFWHKWLGISVAVLAVAGVFITRNGGKISKGFGLLVAAVLGLAGHQGGNLTHGESYLFEHAPPLVQKIAGHAPDSSGMHDWSQVNTDSINLYASFLRPAINQSCVRCHNGGKQNGGLRMDQAHFLFAGGDGGAIISPGAPLESTWVRRVTLPRDNVKAMPPQGDPWDFAQVRLLEYWMANGADTSFLLDPVNIPEDIKKLLEQNYDLDLSPKLFVEKIMAPALAAPQLAELRNLNWAITELVPGGPALEAKPAPGTTVDAAALAKLAALAPRQVSYLSLEQMPLTDEELVPLAKFPNLNRLRLNGTKLTAATVEKLSKLRHLESLNLYDTEIDDTVFVHLRNFSALKRLYLWQTKITTEAAAEFAEARPAIDVNTGFEFTLPPEKTSK